MTLPFKRIQPWQRGLIVGALVSAAGILGSLSGGFAFLERHPVIRAKFAIHQMFGKRLGIACTLALRQGASIPVRAQIGARDWLTFNQRNHRSFGVGAFGRSQFGTVQRSQSNDNCANFNRVAISHVGHSTIESVDAASGWRTPHQQRPHHRQGNKAKTNVRDIVRAAVSSPAPQLPEQSA